MVQKLCNENVCVWKNEAPFSGSTSIPQLTHWSLSNLAASTGIQTCVSRPTFPLRVKGWSAQRTLSHDPCSENVCCRMKAPW